jgi:hypothetical protein
MKIAVGLFGIHYLKKLNHWMNSSTNPDYINTFENNKQFLYNDLMSNGHSIDFYSATYYSDKLLDLIKDYQFKGLSLQHMDNNLSGDLHISFRKRNRIFKKTLKTIIDSDIKDYDLVIATRYDINFMQSIMNLNINYAKINFLHKSKWDQDHNLCDDNFYLMPYSKLQYFYDCIEKIDELNASHEYHHHIPSEETNFMVDGAYYSHESKIYGLHRGFPG